ncbi:radical SAM protein [Hydrogenophilus thiooxidans]|uniref:radical SAM protein n=1 Tax=Hydrogenophilus thiooxidans TaxID=2820326 RepID=UPI001C210E59|nr:radical SAM protein [Hydrogenophilus thiooxidans]
MIELPIRYVEPVFRPPSEANSLILPVTDGCSWNQCTFCEMYTAPQKKFRARSEAEVLETIRRCGEAFGPHVRRVFLADGDAMVLPTRRLVAILEALNAAFPNLQRVSSYCLPRNLRKKTVAELKALAERKLTLVYVGAESGDDTVLQRVHKGETFATTEAALYKLAEAGIRRSVMFLLGLGGKALWSQHIAGSAALANRTQPEYLATLVVSFPLGKGRFLAAWPDWEEQDLVGLLKEMRALLQQLELKETIFRSDHASNWLVLKGTLNKDKAKLLHQVEAALADPAHAPLRPAWARGL